ncbi:AAC(3) family N-acetyltransferase, partial [Rhizobium johnstonii]
AAMKRVVRLLNGPDVLIEALRDAVGPSGTILSYTDWNGAYDALLDENGLVPPEWRAHIAPFDPAVSRAAPGVVRMNSASTPLSRAAR